MRSGVERIRKLKVEHAKRKTELGRTKYSLNQAPEVFVRKALESSDDEDQDCERERGKVSGRGKNYKLRGKKLRISEEEFPQLVT